MRYFIVALVVSLAWLHQDWFVWPLLAELNDQNNFLSWLVAEEHEVKFGIPANVGFQLFLSFATAGVALLAVWKAWPTELERWAEAGNGNRGNRGGRDRGRGRAEATATEGDAIVRAETAKRTPAAQLNDRLIESRAKTTPHIHNPRSATIPQTNRAGAAGAEAEVAEAMAGATHNLNRRQVNESPSCRLRIQSAALDLSLIHISEPTRPY